ncbi:MAG: tyrosine-type recombinase/integrase, partial [Clostridia bacterium]|nr:tyrosine-type recombinase/integrase [Clostridia bacterium]
HLTLEVVMNIEKLKSGNYRVRLFLGKDNNGKQIVKSFTAPTKNEAIFLASEYKIKSSKLYVPTLKEACDAFMELKSDASPTTQRSRNTFIKTRFQQLMDVQLDNLTVDMIQNQLDFEKTNIIRGRNKTLSSRYMKDMLSFYLMVIKRYYRDCTFLIEDFKIDKEKQKEYKLPTIEEMQKIYELIKGTDIEIGILLASRMSLRTSEIRGLKWQDVFDGVIYIHQAKVMKDKLKETKTKTSTRYIPIPEDIQVVFDNTPRTSEFVFPHYQNYLYRHFSKLLKDNGLPHYTIHSLRHFFATYALYKGCDQRTVEAIGGWTPYSKVMVNTYQKVLIDKMKQEMSKMC